MNVRKIVLDTETTGINKKGIYYLNHRIIEIGAIEIINRKITGKKFHTYINPKRLIDNDAFKIHGISNNFLLDKPTFDVILNKFIKFIYGSELIIHNSKFDIDFINYELNLLNSCIKDISKICNITDSLTIARKIFPKKRNSLDALCERFNIEKRNLHGALKDSESLAKIFLLLTGGQRKFLFEFEKNNFYKNNVTQNKLFKNKFLNLKVIYANSKDVNNHKNFLQYVKKKYKLKI